MKNRILLLVGAFLLLVPFRLPISILFVRFFEWIIGITSSQKIPDHTLATNVIVSKTIYNIALSAWFVYNIEMASRNKLGRKAQEKYFASISEKDFFWWTAVIAGIAAVFIVIDGIAVSNIFFGK